MEKLNQFKELVKRNKKKIIAGSIVVVGVVGGVLIVKYLSTSGDNAVEEVIEIVADNEEALDGLKTITIETF